MLSHRKKTPHTSLCVSLAHVDPVCPQRPARTWPLSFPGSGSYTGPIACPSLNSFPEHHENSSSLVDMTPGWHMASFSQQLLSPSPAYEGGNPKAPTFFFFPTLASVCPTLGFTSFSPTMSSFAPPHLPKPSRKICLPTSPASFASTCMLSLSFTLPHPRYVPPFRFFPVPHCPSSLDIYHDSADQRVSPLCSAYVWENPGSLELGTKPGDHKSILLSHFSS